MDRRTFIKSTALAAVGVAFWPQRLVRALAEEAAVRWDRTLLLVELKGGNDGLNTVVPYTDKHYHAVRPRLAVPRDGVLQLSDALGLHPAMKPLLPLWEKNEVAVVLGVGYPNPNRSHFRSIEIWDTAADSDAFLSEGWIAQAFAESSPPAEFPADGLVVGRTEAGPLAGTRRTVSLAAPENFLQTAKRLSETRAATRNPALAHLIDVQEDVLAAAAAMEERLKKAPVLKTAFPHNRLGRDLETAARLLASGLPVPVVKVSHPGYDTHQNQKGTHERLLGELAAGLAAFRDACGEAGIWDRILVMTYAEFGRRVAENGSGGTDHGTAAPHFLLGGKVKGGLYGRQPSLTDLAGGDLKFAVDYRSLYATAARSWWNLPASFLKKEFAPIPCLT